MLCNKKRVKHYILTLFCLFTGLSINAQGDIIIGKGVSFKQSDKSFTIVDKSSLFQSSKIVTYSKDYKNVDFVGFVNSGIDMVEKELSKSQIMKKVCALEGAEVVQDRFCLYSKKLENDISVRSLSFYSVEQEGSNYSVIRVYNFSFNVTSSDKEKFNKMIDILQNKIKFN